MKARKTKPAVPKRARPERPRRKMPLVSDEMKHWSAMLRSELEGWPQATARPMFGMLGIYRGKKIFAALPVTRADISKRHHLPVEPDVAAVAESRREGIAHQAGDPRSEMVCV